MPVSSSVCFAAEVGLSGEVRAINRVEQRISEAQKLGFERIYISQYNKVSKSNKGIQVIALSKVDQLIQALF
jgi:DNA repair protein RadA/Sms